MKNLLFNSSLIIVVAMILPWPMLGQNLVSNGGFEDTLSCPDFGDQIWKAKGWYAVSGTPDLIHECSSYPYVSMPHSAHLNLYPKEGSAVSSCALTIVNNQILEYEYISIRLLHKLFRGHDYCLNFWVLTSDTNKYAIDKIGALFSNDSIPIKDGMIDKSPSLESEAGIVINNKGWIKLNFQYVAEGRERFITFGQFNELNKLKIDTVNVNGSFATWWFFDDISLIDCTPSLILEIPNVFTPNGDGENDSFTATIENVESVQVHIYNRWGGEVFTSQDPNFRWNGTHNGEDLAEGVYFVVIQARGLNGEVATEKQAVHLLR